MQVPGTRSLSPLRQPTSMRGGQLDQKLIFVYPILCDSTIQKHVTLIRDFIAVDFISQIKTANILNITTNATQVGRIGQGQNSRNPAQEVRQALWHDTANNSGDDNIYSAYRDAQDVPRYQDKVNKQLAFIKNQLQYDHRLQAFRPVISSIAVEENLLDIPLIVGTHAYQTEAMAVYWVLLGSILFNLPLTNQANLQNIVNNLLNIPDQNMAAMLSDEALTLLASPAYNRGMNRNIFYLGDSSREINTQKTANLIREDIRRLFSSFRNCLDPQLWASTTPHLSGNRNISWDAIPVVQTPSERRHFERSILSFSSYFTNIVVPILHGCEMLLGPTPSNINFQDKVIDYTENVIDSMSEIYQNISANITRSLRNVQSQQMDNATRKLKDMSAACKMNAEIYPDIKKILNTLEINSELPTQFTGANLSSFTETVAQAANKLQAHTTGMLNVLRDIVGDATHLNRNIHEIFNRIDRSSHAFFYPENNRDDYYLFAGDTRVYGHHEINHRVVVFRERHSNFFNLICNAGDEDRCFQILNKIVKELKSSIDRIVKFLFLWNFFSYSCDYLKDIEMDVEIQQRDVLEFPNFCLVIPMELLKGLYAVHSARNFKRLIQSRNAQTELADIMNSEDFIPNPSNVKRVLTIIANRLQVPNIIAIDSKKEEIAYKLMYMSNPAKARLQTLQQFVTHQKEVLPGF